MSEYSNCLGFSGYTAVERFNTIRGCVMRYEDMKNKVFTSEYQGCLFGGFDALIMDQYQIKCVFISVWTGCTIA